MFKWSFIVIKKYLENHDFSKIILKRFIKFDFNLKSCNFKVNVSSVISTLI